MANMNEKIVNQVKMLSLDMIEKAGSGHPGITLSAAPIITALYLNELNIIPNKPNWMNRDRFILSAGHASSLLYSVLHYAGYDISVEDLKRFREIDSYCPGHPELNILNGIECSTGALGQGIANAVGIAFAERYYENICQSIDKKSTLVNFNTYVLASEGDFQEGIAYEALSFAAAQKLDKLTVILDYNKVQLDGNLDNAFIEDIEERFEALDFDVFVVKNGNNINEITNALKSARKSKLPSLIIVNSIIGYDSKNEGTNLAHSSVIDKAEINSMKAKYKLPVQDFYVDPESRKYFLDTILKRVNKKFEQWNEEYMLARRGTSKELNLLIELMEKNVFSIDFDSTNYKINDNYCEPMRISNKKVMNFIAPKSPFFVGGCADVANSTLALIEKSGIASSLNPTGRNIAFGVREHAMAGILNGMALCNLRVFGSTFLTFSDYMKPAMRMSAMMNLPVTYLFSHDSVSIGQDGPTHQPIEQLSSLRLVPNMKVFRPADINELIGAWEFSMKNLGPSCIVYSKEQLGILKHTNGKYTQYGAYIVRKERYHLNGVLIATGSEVHMALRIAEELFTQGIDLRVVSMPCVELFLRQNPIYEEKLLPKDVKIMTLEAGSTMLWNRFASNPSCAFGIDSFGISGKKDDVLKYTHFDYNTILMKIKKMYES